jgi:hypothetical protein
MKYFKFTMVDAKTGISINRETSLEGPTLPPIDGLEVLFQDTAISEFWYGRSNSKTAKDNPENQTWELSLSEFSDVISTTIQRSVNNIKDVLYISEKEARDIILGKYHATASLAGIYKYDQAVAYLNDPTVIGSELSTEATVRGLSIQDMATRIKTNHESFRLNEATIAGIRGMLLDRLNDYVYNGSANPWAAYQDYLRPEQVGTRTQMVFEDGNMVDKEIPVTVPYHGSDIITRFTYRN